MVIKQKYIRAIHGDTGIWNQTPIIIVSKMALLWIWNADKFLIYKIPEYWKLENSWFVARSSWWTFHPHWPNSCVTLCTVWCNQCGFCDVFYAKSSKSSQQLNAVGSNGNWAKVLLPRWRHITHMRMRQHFEQVRWRGSQFEYVFLR
jgi:hypothetical protein